MRKVFYIIIIFFIFSSFGYALETDTHEKINENIAKEAFNGFSLDHYLSDNIHPHGIDMPIRGLEVWMWLRDGGKYEDIPVFYLRYFRSVNHFHNPLVQELENAGFSGIWGTGFLSGKSAIAWSQREIGKQSPGVPPVLPVALGFGEGSESRQPMAVAIAGGSSPPPC